MTIVLATRHDSATAVTIPTENLTCLPSWISFQSCTQFGNQAKNLHDVGLFHANSTVQLLNSDFGKSRVLIIGRSVRPELRVSMEILSGPRPVLDSDSGPLRVSSASCGPSGTGYRNMIEVKLSQSPCSPTPGSPTPSFGSRVAHLGHPQRGSARWIADKLAKTKF